MGFDSFAGSVRDAPQGCVPRAPASPSATPRRGGGPPPEGTPARPGVAALFWTLLALVLTVGGLAAVVVLAGSRATDALRDQLAPLGEWSIALYLVVYLLWNLTTVPALPLMTLAGVLYGPLAGSAWALVGTTVAAAVTFGIGRRWGHGPMHRLEGRSPGVSRVMGLVDRYPFLAVAVVRTAPFFPLSLLNYGLGASRMRFSTYMWSTVATTVPGVALYTGAGDLLAAAFAGERVGVEQVAWVAGFAVLGAWVVRFVKRRWPGTDG